MRLNNFFSKHPIFTIEEVTQFYALSHPNGSAAGKLNRGTLKSLLTYHQKQGRIVRLRRGLYYSIPLGSKTDSYALDQFLIAGKLVDDAIISYHAALQLHGLAYSVRYEYTFLTCHADIRSFRHEGCVYKPVLQPESLIKGNHTAFAVQAVERLGIPIHVTSLERTLIDVLDRPDLAGGWEEIFRAFESVTYVQAVTMIQYVKLLNNATTAAKLGFMLDQHRDRLMVADKHINQLRKLAPSTPHYMDRRNRSNGKVLPEWNLIVPVAVLERCWEEHS